MNPKHTINCRGEIIDLSSPKIMGILNVTPDSFFEGSRKVNRDDVLEATGKMIKEGADFLDVGGYSSRPGAEDISVEAETERAVTAIQWIKEEFPETLISIDTFRSPVAIQAIQEGASLINDISGGKLDDKMYDVVADLAVPYIAMHMRGTPQTMQDNTDYDNLIKDMLSYFSVVIKECQKRGIKDLIVDPGFGFAKTIEQNFELLNQLESLETLKKPILVGLSRKSMIYRSLNLTADEALNGTTTLNTLALFKGACILRVHDVKEAVEVVKLVNQLS